MPAPTPARVVRAVRRRAGRLVRRPRPTEVQETTARATERLFAAHDPQATVDLDDVDAPVDEAGPALDDRPGDDDLPADTAPVLTPPARVVGVLTPRSAAVLAEIVPVSTLVPGARAIGARLTGGDVFVVERDALQGGPWSATESAVGTALLAEVLDWFAAAGDDDVPIVLLDSRHASNVGTNLLRAGADVTFPQARGIDDLLGATPRTAVFAALDQLAREATEVTR